MPSSIPRTSALSDVKTSSISSRLRGSSSTTNNLSDDIRVSLLTSRLICQKRSGALFPKIPTVAGPGGTREPAGPGGEDVCAITIAQALSGQPHTHDGD